MNLHSDILKLIISRLDNNSIQNLSLVPGIWNEISLFSREDYFWFLRTQELVSRNLSWQEGNWKEVYYILSSSRKINNDQDNALAASIVLSLGADPSENDNSLIECVSANGRTNIVRLLLQDKRVDPSANKNQAIRYASSRGHIEVVRLLLQDERVDPTVMDNNPIVTASEHYHMDIVRLLLEDGRVDPSGSYGTVIGYAFRYGEAEIVRLLLQDERIDPSWERNYGLRVASEKGYIEVVRLLLQDRRVIDSEDIIADTNLAIITATKNQHLEILKMLEEFLRKLR